MADALLIWPQPFLQDVWLEQGEQQMLPLGLSYVGAALQAAGYSVAAVDMCQRGMSLDELAALVERQRPRLVGISCTAISYGRALAVAGLVKERQPQTPVVMGGPHVSFCAPATLATGKVDVVVHGEGDLTAAELARCLLEGQGTPEQVAGISFCRDGRVVRTPSRPFISRLDSLPIPAADLFDVTAYATHPIATSRGCPFTCVFCSAGAFSGGRYRLRSPEHVVDEAAWFWQRHGRREFFIVDDTFTASPKRALRLAALMADRCPGVQWWCESRVDRVSRELLAQLRAAGCCGVHYGIESGNQGVLDQIGKGITLAQAEAAVAAALGAGIPEVFCSFIIGHPFDTVATVRQTIAFARRLREQGAGKGGGQVICRISTLVPFPGTPVFDQAAELGVNVLLNDWSRYSVDDIMLETRHLSAETLRELFFEYQTTLDLPLRKS